MNFLSHYYFDQHTASCYFILGTVLPDLLKNADKTIIIHPEKLQHTNPGVNAIIKGWNKHLLVDKYFHTSDFFVHHSHVLKNLLAPAIAGSPVKPFFLGHIAIELILDNLLITTKLVHVDGFYEHLNKCTEDVMEQFLTSSGLKDQTRFFKFYNEFKSSRYLNTYIHIERVTYALKRICMRIWPYPFTTQQEDAVTLVLADYRQSILPDFKAIYEQIDQKLIA